MDDKEVSRRPAVNASHEQCKADTHTHRTSKTSATPRTKRASSSDDLTATPRKKHVSRAGATTSSACLPHFPQSTRAALPCTTLTPPQIHHQLRPRLLHHLRRFLPTQTRLHIPHRPQPRIHNPLPRHASTVTPNTPLRLHRVRLLHPEDAQDVPGCARVGEPRQAQRRVEGREQDHE